MKNSLISMDGIKVQGKYFIAKEYAEFETEEQFFQQIHKFFETTKEEFDEYFGFWNFPQSLFGWTKGGKKPKRPQPINK